MQTHTIIGKPLKTVTLEVDGHALTFTEGVDVAVFVVVAAAQSALEGNLTPGHVKNTYLPLWDTLKDVFTRIPKRNEEEAQTILKTALAKLRELAER